jgi:hypothetical protein
MFSSFPCPVLLQGPSFGGDRSWDTILEFGGCPGFEPSPWSSAARGTKRHGGTSGTYIGDGHSEFLSAATVMHRHLASPVAYAGGELCPPRRYMLRPGLKGLLFALDEE